MNDITALILTYNEAPNIVRNLRALGWIPRVIIIDSFSTDATLEIAKLAHPNVTVVQRPFDTHATQWNFGLEQITTPWVLSLDADYEVSAELALEMQNTEPTQNVAGYVAAFRYLIYGRPLRASVYPERTVLFRTGAARYFDDGHTQRLKVEGDVQKLHGPIYHDDRKPLSRWIGAQDRYAMIEATHLLSMPRERLSLQDKLRLKVFCAPFIMPIYLLFAKRLILDGWPGWFYVLQRTIAEMLLSLRLLIERQKLASGSASATARREDGS